MQLISGRFLILTCKDPNSVGNGAREQLKVIFAIHARTIAPFLLFDTGPNLHRFPPISTDTDNSFPQLIGGSENGNMAPDNYANAVDVRE
jgi:hypothetical protein